jgi:hypothetical protein
MSYSILFSDCNCVQISVSLMRATYFTHFILLDLTIPQYLKKYIVYNATYFIVAYRLVARQRPK